MTTTPSTDLTERKNRLSEIQVSRQTGATIDTMADAWTLAQAFHSAGMVPQSFKSPQQVMVAFLAAAEIGLGPAAALKHMMVVNGVPSLYGDGPMAICLRSGLVKRHASGTDGTSLEDDFTAWFEVERTGVEGIVRREFSVADAKAAGLWGKSGPWRNHPKRMLFVRARAFTLRDAFPDVLGGLGIAEELVEAETGNDGHATRSDAMLAQLQEARHAPAVDEAAVDEVPEDVAWSEEPSPEEIEAIRAREIAEAKEQGLFGEEGGA